MNGITLLIYIVAFGMGCMALALSIVYNIQSPHSWTKYFIICHASLLGCMMLMALQLLSELFLTGMISLVVSSVVRAVFIADVTFLIVFIPFFTTWVIAHPWRNPYKTLFFALAFLYLVLGIFNAVHPSVRLDDILLLIFVFVLGFCLIVMLKNINSIENKTARATCLTIIIVSAAMLPTILLALMFPAVKAMLYGIYFLAFSITIMVFLYMEFLRNRKGFPSGSKELTLSDVGQYHITEREFSVIQLIFKGLTNKEIATQLHISANTVNNHVANIFSKTNVRSRIDLLNLLKQPW